MSNHRTRQRRSRRQARRRLPWRKIAAVAALAAALPAVALAGWFFVAGSDDGPDGPPRAVIVDQLSLTAPNPNFQDEATEMLEAAGYLVDYVRGEEVTVDYYRDLPKQDYEIVLLRAHAAGRDFGGESYGDDVSLFTSERVSATKYTEEQENRRLKGVGFTDDDFEEGNLYFGIPPSFVESSMRGDFGGATVVLMGCDVLRAQNMAEAFGERGAGTVVGWDQSVTASHTDAATLSMLGSMLDDGLSAHDAAAAAMDEVGPDPFTGSELLAYESDG